MGGGLGGRGFVRMSAVSHRVRLVFIKRLDRELRSKYGSFFKGLFEQKKKNG